MPSNTVHNPSTVVFRLSAGYSAKSMDDVPRDPDQLVTNSGRFSEGICAFHWYIHDRTNFGVNSIQYKYFFAIETGNRDQVWRFRWIHWRNRGGNTLDQFSDQIWNNGENMLHISSSRSWFGIATKQINIMDVKDDEIPKYNIINLQTLKAHWMRALKCGCLSSKLL